MKRKIITNATGDPELVDPLEQLTQTDGEAFANWVLGYDPTSGTNIQEMTISAPDTSLPPFSAGAGLVRVNDGAKFLVSKIVALAQSGNLVGKDLPHTVFANAFEASYTGGVLSYTRLGGIDVDFSMTNNGYATPATLTTSLPDGTTPPTTITLGDTVGTTIFSISATSPGPWNISTDVGIGTHEARTFRVCQPGFYTPNQYIYPGQAFIDLCLEVLNETGSGVPDVPISRHGGGFWNSLIPSKQKTNSEGKVYVRFVELSQIFGTSEIKGKLFKFKISDPDIEATVDAIYDERGEANGSIDKNRVPYDCGTYTISGWCPGGGKEIRARLVRTARIPMNPLHINIDMSGIQTEIDNWRGKLESHFMPNAYKFTTDELYLQMQSHMEQVFSDMGITAVSIHTNTPATSSLDDIDVEFNNHFWLSKSVFGHTFGPVKLNPTWFFTSVWVHWDPRADSANKEGFSMATRAFDYIRFGRSFANTALHEMAHKLGLVNRSNLNGGDPDVILDTKHNNPSTLALEGSPGHVEPDDIMDAKASWTWLKSGPTPFFQDEPIQKFRPINVIYLRHIMK